MRIVLKKHTYLHLFLFCLIVFVMSFPVFGQTGVRPASDISNDTIDWMKTVADWQLTQSSWDSSVSWERGALHAGLMACYEATKDETYLIKCREWAEKFNWQLGWNSSNHADNMACAQAYQELYFLDEQDSFRYQDFKDQSDDHVALWPEYTCSGTGSDYWWWCDALFMAPPALVRLSRATGDPIYTNFMHMMWEDTQDCLYDTTEHLFFRDINYFYPGTQNCNGDKMFWSRGNGWVLAGTARTLQYLPLDDPNRPGYIILLQELSGKLRDIQQPDGYWYSDLLGPACYDNPESSGTGFFTFGIAWGINNGYLDAATYWPTVEAGWDALKLAVQPSGLLGWVQPVGAGPTGTTATTTDVFGVGAYLLAGSEVQKYLLSQDPNSIEYFESYTNDAALEAAWADGSTNGTSSQVALGDYGDNFMELTYHNDQSPYRSETTYTFASPKDFTANNAYYLSVLVRGNAANTAEQMYVRLEDADMDSAIQIMTEPNVVQTAEWMELAFPLPDFTGINPAQISKLTIGVGTPGASSATGQGTIRIDNIRLFSGQCVTVQEDFVSDCKINLLDFAVMAAQWMDEYAETVTPLDPGTADLTAYWAFEDVSVDDYAYDSVAQAYNGRFRSGTTWEQFSGKYGGAVRFAGPLNTGSRMEIPTTGLSAGAGTVAMWLRPEGSQSSPSTRYIFGHTTIPVWGNRIQLYLDNGNTELDAGLGNTHLLSTNNYSLPTEDWTHAALTWDGVNYQVYVNGLLKSSGTYSGLSDIQSGEAHIGNNGSDGTPGEAFNGLMDDVRIYSTVLTPANMLFLAEAGTYSQIPDPRPTDLVLDGTINLADLLKFLEKWTQDTHWP